MHVCAHVGLGTTLWSLSSLQRYGDYLQASGFHLVYLRLLFSDVHVYKSGRRVWGVSLYSLTLCLHALLRASRSVRYLAAAAVLLREHSNLVSFLLRVVIVVEAKSQVVQFTLNSLHSRDWPWTLNPMPPECSAHVVVHFPVPSRDRVRFIMSIQCVTDLKGLKDLSHSNTDMLQNMAVICFCVFAGKLFGNRQLPCGLL